MSSYSVVERESPEVLRRNLSVGSRLGASALVFFFFAFLFAYFYLRSLNAQHEWRPKGVDPSLVLGTVETAALVAAGVLLRLAFANHLADNLRAWRQKGGVAAALVLLAIVLQIVEWATQGFGPTDGGYASVYIGWTSLQVLFLVGLLYWVETTLATSLRYRKGQPAEFPRGEAAGDPHREAPDVEDPLSILGAELEALSFFTLAFAGVAVVTWAVLYLV
jgi:heme/copper-type cytochrome/quinol oxidase subunit 3